MQVAAAEKFISSRMFFKALSELAKIPSSLSLSSSSDDTQLLSSIESMKTFALSVIDPFMEVHISKVFAASQSLSQGQQSFDGREFHEALRLFDSSRTFAREASDPTPYVGQDDTRTIQWLKLSYDCKKSYEAADVALQTIAENSKRLRLGMELMADGERHMLGRDYSSAVTSFTTAESALRNVDDITCGRALNLRMECESMIAQERRSALLQDHLALISKLAAEASHLWHAACSEGQSPSSAKAFMTTAELRNDVCKEQLQCCRSVFKLPTSLSAASAFIWDQSTCTVWDQRFESCMLSERISANQECVVLQCKEVEKGIPILRHRFDFPEKSTVVIIHCSLEPCAFELVEGFVLESESSNVVKSCFVNCSSSSSLLDSFGLSHLNVFQKFNLTHVLEHASKTLATANAAEGSGDLQGAVTAFMSAGSLYSSIEYVAEACAAKASADAIAARLKIENTHAESLILLEQDIDTVENKIKSVPPDYSEFDLSVFDDLSDEDRLKHKQNYLEKLEFWRKIAGEASHARC